MKKPRKLNQLNSSDIPWEEPIEAELMEEFITKENPETIFSDLYEDEINIGESLPKFKKTVVVSSKVTGGDPDDNWYQAEVVGEEAVGGQTPTPDQNVTEQLLQAMGVSSIEGELLQVREKLEYRDRRRWELRPESAEDYEERP